MKKTVIGLCLLAVGVWGIMIIQPQADGAYFQNNGSFTIAIDTGSVSTDSTRDSGIVSTPIPAYRFRGYTVKFKVGESDNNIGGWNGNGDRAVLRLRTRLGDGQVKTLDSINASPPCSLFFELPLDKIANDSALARSKSLYKELFFAWIISDTCSEVADTGKSVMIPWYWEAIVRE